MLAHKKSLPPGNFWERFETGRVASRLPLAESENVEDLLGKFPPGHPYRDLVVWPARFCCDLSSETGHLPPLALARLHGSWTRGLYALAGGEDELEDFLLERFRAHGGLCALDDRVSELVVERGRIQGVLLSGEEEPFGTDYVVTNLTGEMVAELSGGAGLTKVAERQWPRVEAGTGRFVVSLLVRQVGLPERLPRETLLISSDPDSPRHPVLRLQRLPSETEAAELLVAEMILPRYGPLDLLEAREAVMGTLREHFPFIDEHVIVVDSPHDGLPLYDFRTGSRREWDRIHVPETSNQAEEMAWQWACEPLGYLGISGEPVRGPTQGTLLVGTTVLPGFGQEGELLAAWSAARIVTRKDRTRQHRRRQLWTKIETS